MRCASLTATHQTCRPWLSICSQPKVRFSIAVLAALGLNVIRGVEVQDLGAPHLGGVDHAFEADKPAVDDAILVAVEEDGADDRMVGLHPAVRAAAEQRGLVLRALAPVS